MLMNMRQIIERMTDGLHSLLEKCTPWHRLGLMYIIRYLYMILSLVILKDLYYVGYGSYGIDFSFGKELLSCMVFLPVSMLFVFYPVKDRFIRTVMALLYFLYYIPMNCAFSMNRAPFLFFIFSNGYFTILQILIKLITEVARIKRPQKAGKLNKPGTSGLYKDQGVFLCCAVICVLFILYKLAYNGLSLSFSMDSGDVYGNRAEFQEYLDSISGSLLSYLFAILRNIVAYAAPYLVLVSLMQRKWRRVALGMLCIVAQFSVSSGKSTLLFVLIVAALWLLYELRLLRDFDRLLEWGVLAVLLLCVVEHILLRSDRLFMLIVRRMMYLPAWLNTMYMEYFTDNGPVLWSQNTFLLQNLLKPMYDTSPLTIISNVYFGGKVPSPNTGLLAEAIMHVGEVGILLYPVGLCLMLMVSSAIMKPYGLCVQLFMAIKLTLQIQNVPVTRTDFVLSYCLFLAMLWIVPKLRLPELLGMLIEMGSDMWKNRKKKRFIR